MHWGSLDWTDLSLKMMHQTISSSNRHTCSIIIFPMSLFETPCFSNSLIVKQTVLFWYLYLAVTSLLCLVANKESLDWCCQNVTKKHCFPKPKYSQGSIKYKLCLKTKEYINALYKLQVFQLPNAGAVNRWPLTIDIVLDVLYPMFVQL